MTVAEFSEGVKQKGRPEGRPFQFSRRSEKNYGVQPVGTFGLTQGVLLLLNEPDAAAPATAAPAEAAATAAVTAVALAAPAAAPALAAAAAPLAAAPPAAAPELISRTPPYPLQPANAWHEVPYSAHLV